jgi:hypothetical protein
VDKEQLAEYLDTGNSGLSSFESDEDPDLVEIKREHSQFEAYKGEVGPDGQPTQPLPQIAFWQSHPKHLDGHFRLMKRDRERFERWSPAAQQAFLAHMQETVQAVDEIAGQVAGGQPGVPVAGEDAPPGGPGGPDPSGKPQLTVEDGGGAPAGSPAGQRPTLQNADFAAAGQ